MELSHDQRLTYQVLFTLWLTSIKCFSIFSSPPLTQHFIEVPPALPYMIRRSRMHNVPVYTDLTHGSRKTTLVRKVEGDIWVSETEFLGFFCQSIVETSAELHISKYDWLGTRVEVEELLYLSSNNFGLNVMFSCHCAVVSP